MSNGQVTSSDPDLPYFGQTPSGVKKSYAGLPNSKFSPSAAATSTYTVRLNTFSAMVTLLKLGLLY